MSLKKLFKKVFKKKVDLKEKGIKYVKENFGEEYVDEFIENYENINRGIPIGNYFETVVFLKLIDTIKAESD